MKQQQFLLCLNGRLTLPFDLLFPGVSQSTNICTNVACNIKWLTQLNLANLLRRIYLIFCHTFMYDCMSFDYNYRYDYTGQPFKCGYCGRNSCCRLYYSYTHHHYRHHHCILQVSRCPFMFRMFSVVIPLQFFIEVTRKDKPIINRYRLGIWPVFLSISFT